MLDSVKAGDTVGLSLLLAFMAEGSSFSHTVAISVLRLRCGCVKAAGVRRPFMVELCSIHPVQSKVIFVSSRPLGLPFLCISPFPLAVLSVLPSIPPASFLSSRKTLVFGKRRSSFHLCFSHLPLPRAIVADPSFVCVFTAAVKDKKQSLPPFLLFSGRMSPSFPWFLCPR